MRSLFFIGGLAVSTTAFAFACSSSSVDNTDYGLPDSGNHPDANFCVADQDCPPDNAGNQFACGFPIADKCEARGVCVATSAGASSGQCGLGNYCGCEGELVSTCPLNDTTSVRGGPTNGNKPKTLADGGLSCAN